MNTTNKGGDKSERGKNENNERTLIRGGGKKREKELVERGKSGDNKRSMGLDRENPFDFKHLEKRNRISARKKQRRNPSEHFKRKTNAIGTLGAAQVCKRAAGSDTTLFP